MSYSNIDEFVTLTPWAVIKPYFALIYLLLNLSENGLSQYVSQNPQNLKTYGRNQT